MCFSYKILCNNLFTYVLVQYTLYIYLYNTVLLHLLFFIFTETIKTFASSTPRQAFILYFLY